jgi:hypothetical protein
MLIRMSSVPTLTRAEVDEVNALARLPLQTQQGRRRALIAQMRRKGFAAQVMAQYLRLTPAQLHGELGQSQGFSAQAAIERSRPR